MVARSTGHYPFGVIQSIDPSNPLRAGMLLLEKLLVIYRVFKLKKIYLSIEKVWFQAKHLKKVQTLVSKGYI